MVVVAHNVWGEGKIYISTYEVEISTSYRIVLPIFRISQFYNLFREPQVSKITAKYEKRGRYLSYSKR